MKTTMTDKIPTVASKYTTAQFVEAIRQGKHAQETPIAIGFDGTTVHLVTCGPFTDDANADPESIKKWDPLAGHSYMAGMSFNGANVGFSYDAALERMPSFPTFQAALVHLMAERMAALRVDAIEDSLELPVTHAQLVLKVGGWMKNEITSMKVMEYRGKTIEHFVLHGRNVGATVSFGKNVYYVPVTQQKLLDMDTGQWTKMGETEKPIAYLSRKANGKIIATLKGEAGHQIISGLDKLTPDNPKAAKIGTETKGAGIVLGMLTGKRTIALFAKAEDGTRRTIVVGMNNPKAPRIARDLQASAA